MRHFDESIPFIAEVHKNGIATLQATDDDSETSIGFINQALRYVEQIERLLEQDEVKAVMYYSLFPHIRMRYKRLFKEEQNNPDYEEKLYSLLVKIEQLKKQPKPIIAYINYYSCGIDLAFNLWPHYTLMKKDRNLYFPEFQYGLLPALGAIRHTLNRMPFKEAYQFLTESNQLTTAEALSSGLLTHLMPQDSDTMTIVQQIVQEHKPTEKSISFSQEDIDYFKAIAEKTHKKTRGLIPATNAFLEIVSSTLQPDGTDLLRQEAKLFSAVIANKKTEAMVRTGYYFMGDIRRMGISLDMFETHRIGIIGAGMMGAGICYEAAKAGKTVFLKDTTLEQAVLGKDHVAQICEKRIQRGQMTKAGMKNILRRIHPVATYMEFQELDTIIEAVFENDELKKTVIQASCSSLREESIFASNTTSLLISQLATASEKPENFVGMHFFSPVDRMKVVEIVRGKQTSGRTIERAMKLANQLGKTVLVVKDSPAFYTSRVFFNYLLEAITLLLEGIPAKYIEQEAQKAGFAVGPLAVLDEISLPLMLHVYDQLPELNPSQKRAYSYLKTLIDQGRSGRKSKKGFYNYQESEKTLWQDPTITTLTEGAFDLKTISKRLLHVMALDSYRCLDEGVLEDPSDADIGSTLGIGFPHHTGGVFGHIEQVGLATFVEECVQFSDKGEQWSIPDSLRKRAAKNYTFYTNFKSNWK